MRHHTRRGFDRLAGLREDHDSAGADAAKLVVTYTPPVKAGGIPQTLMLNDLL